MNETIIAAIIGGGAGVLPVVVTRVFGQMESRSHMRQQVQALDLAKKRVEFAILDGRSEKLPPARDC